MFYNIRKEGRKGGRKERRKEGRKEGRSECNCKMEHATVGLV